MAFTNRKSLIFSILLLLLTACGTDLKKEVSSQASEGQETEVTTKEAEQSLTSDELADSEEKEENEVPDTETITEATGIEKESIYSVQDQALNQLIAVTHLEKEGYSYHFTETASPEFIQIEVREVPEKSFEHTSLEGVYRYLLETEEILIKDYLSGDFIPYEQNK